MDRVGGDTQGTKGISRNFRIHITKGKFKLLSTKSKFSFVHIQFPHFASSSAVMDVWATADLRKKPSWHISQTAHRGRIFGGDMQYQRVVTVQSSSLSPMDHRLGGRGVGGC